MTSTVHIGRRPIARGTIANSAAVGLQVLLSFALAIVLARELGPAEYGRYGVILSILVWVEFAFTLGLPGAASILIARHPDAMRSLERRALGCLALSGVVAVGLIWLAAPAIASVLRLEDGAGLIRIASVDIPFYVLYVGYRGILQGRKRLGRVAVATMIYFAAKFLLVGGVVMLGGNLEAALLGNAGASIVVLGALLWLARHVRQPGVDVFPLRKLVVLALSIGACATISSLVLQADLWAAKRWIASADEVGLYVAASTLARMLYLALAAMFGSVMPYLAEASARAERDRTRGYLAEAIRYILVLSGLAAAVVCPTAPELLAFLFDAPYRGGGAALAVLVPAQALLGLGMTFFHALLASRRPRAAAAVAGIALVLEAALLVALAPAYGALGVAWSLVATGALLALAGGLAVSRRDDVGFDPTLLARVVVAAGVTAVLLWLCAPGGAWLVPAYIAAALVYAVLLWGLRVLRPDDLEHLPFRRGA